MTDTVTRKPIKVETHGGELGYIRIPLAQLDTVTAVLDANKVPYWVDEEALSMDGGPEITWINLDEDADLALVQRLLDRIP
jgi:hypothetical protein